jgi:hypothetical protein
MLKPSDAFWPVSIPLAKVPVEKEKGGGGSALFANATVGKARAKTANINRIRRRSILILLRDNFWPPFPNEVKHLKEVKNGENSFSPADGGPQPLLRKQCWRFSLPLSY